jgi:hypothetical protein
MVGAKRLLHVLKPLFGSAKTAASPPASVPLTHWADSFLTTPGPMRPVAKNDTFAS